MWSLDRRVATSAFAVAALALIVTIAASDPPRIARAGTDRVVLAQELAALANRGARATWLVTFTFTRTNTTGSTLHDTLLVAHRGSLEVDSGLGSLIVDDGSRTYSCTVVGTEPQCLESAAPAGTARPGDVYGGAVVSGRYDVTRGPTPTVAGLPAQCYVLRLRSGAPLAGVGYSSEQCYSSDGVPLRSHIVRPGGTDERVALTVRRTVGRDDLLPILGPYGLQRLIDAPT
jgi:hypothetical protein